MGRKTHGPYLVAAIEYNDINKVSDILSTKFRDKQKVKHFLTSEVRRLASDYTEVPLLLAATLEDPAILKYFVTKHDTNVNYVHEYGFQKPKKRKTALLVAVRRGLYVMVDTILALNGDVNVQDHKGRTPLHHAVRRADYRMAKILLSRGAQVGIIDASGNSPLHIATIFGHMELVRLLIKHGGDLYKKGQYGAIPIHIAAKEGHASLVRMFCEQYEVNVNIMVPCYDEREKAPLHVAAEEGHAETVFTLLEHCRADVNLRDSEGETPLHCVAIREYDPLGMKSKEDFTETVKVLLNYGAEVNTRNSRGETPLHLAARNEFQKVIEVLVLAGSDASMEDNDKNKPIDLVAPDDTVSKQALKNAMADRERFMAEALEIRARGFTTNLSNHLPFSHRSQSTTNVLHGTHSSSRFNQSHGTILGSNYFPHNGSPRQIFGGQFRQSSHSHSSSSSSKRRSKESIQSVPKLPPSMMFSYDNRPPVPLSKARKAKSVEELDQINDRLYQRRGSSSNISERPKQTNQTRRKNAYQESETTSFWSVTPPGSVREESDIESRRSAKNRKTKSVPKLAPDRRLNEIDEYLNEGAKKPKSKKAEQQMKFLAPRDPDEEKSLGGDESDYFLDDDESVDALEVGRLTKEKRRHEEKMLKAMRHNQYEVKPGVSSWVDEQTRLMQRKTDEKPVAHSTPPLTRNAKQNRHDDETDSEDSFTSDSDDVPPAPISAKPKPLPPPKPVKESVARMGVPVFPSQVLMGSKESINPKSRKYQQDNPNIEQVIQLDVNDSPTPGETVIRVIPVNPTGPAKVHTVTQGSNSTTFLRLQGDASGSVTSEQVEIGGTRSKKKETTKPKTQEPIADLKSKIATPSGNESKMTHGKSRGLDKSKDSVDAVLSGTERKPVPRPRESKPSTSGGKKDRPQISSVSGGESLSASSDEYPIASPSRTKTDTSAKIGKPTHASSPGHAVTAASASRKPAALVFTKAGADAEGSKQKPSANLSLSSTDQDRSVDHDRKKSASSKNVRPENNSKQTTSNSTKKNRPVLSSQINESDEEESSEEEESTDDEVDADDASSASASQDLRTINLNSDGNLSYTLVGGNVDGVFVHALDRASEAARKDLRCGDQILKANDQVILGRTRDEAMQILRSMSGPTSLVVRRMPQKYRAAEKNDGMADSLYVRAHFNYVSTKSGELNVHEGDVFHVSDTFPESNVGFWKAKKMNAKEDEEPNGFIPCRSKADQITLKQRLTQGKIAPDQRGGAFLRSFRRAKSADRNSRGQDDDEKLMSTHGIVSYERVSQNLSNYRRPVVVLGLFCDVVVSRLVKDSPDLFETAAEGVENVKDTQAPVNVRLLQSTMNHGKHSVMILAPPSIEYLQQKTDINPIVVYLSPVSKPIVKALKAKMAPFYNKNTGYMYDEAVRFEKNYEHLFSANVLYTNDEWWFFNLKEAITQVQNRPVWQPVDQLQLETKIYQELGRILPEPVAKQQILRQQGNSRPSRDKTARMSRTTDDLPLSTVTVTTSKSPESSGSSETSKRSILKQQQRTPASTSVNSVQEPQAGPFHRLHSHNFDGPKKRMQQTIQSHETPL